MVTHALSDADLGLVADVARREAWADLSAPPATHPPRTLREERAVTLFAAAGPRRRDRRRSALRARLMVAAIVAGVLGTCWIISPTRTAVGLIGAGVVCLIAMGRRGRRQRRGSAIAR